MSVMLSEIAEEPAAMLNTLISSRTSANDAWKAISESDYTIITGSGTSYHAGLSLQLSLMKMSIPAIPVKAPDFSNYIPEILKRKVCVVIISQSGESTDAMNALECARKAGSTTIGITNEKDSRLARNADIAVITSAGTEKAVAATKSYVSQLAAISIIQGYAESFDPVDNVEELARWSGNTIADTSPFQALSDQLRNKMVFLGNGFLFGTAMEGALKFSETGNLLTQAYQVREYLHGPIQTLDNETTVFLLRENGTLYEEVMAEIRKYTDSVITIGTSQSDTVQVMETHPSLSPIAYVLPIQILACFKSLALGLNPDNPGKLTKVVK